MKKVQKDSSTNSLENTKCHYQIYISSNLPTKAGLSLCNQENSTRKRAIDRSQTTSSTNNKNLTPQEHFQWVSHNHVWEGWNTEQRMMQDTVPIPAPWTPQGENTTTWQTHYLSCEAVTQRTFQHLWIMFSTLVYTESHLTSFPDFLGRSQRPARKHLAGDCRCHNTPHDDPQCFRNAAKEAQIKHFNKCLTV